MRRWWKVFFYLIIMIVLSLCLARRDEAQDLLLFNPEIRETFMQLTTEQFEEKYWESALTGNSEQYAELNSIADKILANRDQYDKVEAACNIPWECVAAIHYREGGLDFNTHLHNGDPLSARTVHVPAGRPIAPPESGHFPYQWFESACDALRNVHMSRNIGACLQFLEQYNGLGYANRGIPSPYIWSYTDQYTSGYYVGDGVFSPTAVNQQAGCAAIFKILNERGIFDFDT